jgi:hypothetical protein
MALPGFSWQNLGAFIATAQNVDDARLDRFAAAGGRYILPILYGDAATGPWNLANIASLKARALARGIHTGIWVGCHGQDPTTMMAEVKAIVDEHKLACVVLNAEAEYQLNTQMAHLVDAARKAFPLGSRALAVSTNSMNDSQVYNGRKGGYPAPVGQSFRAKNIHVLPQWYSWVPSPFMHADSSMKWVHEEGMLDNWLDTKYADKRAVAKSQIHGTLEVTGLEGASLTQSLTEVSKAKALYGYGLGISIYTLENAPASDFALLKAQKGVLFR